MSLGQILGDFVAYRWPIPLPLLTELFLLRRRFDLGRSILSWRTYRMWLSCRVAPRPAGNFPCTLFVGDFVVLADTKVAC